MDPTLTVVLTVGVLLLLPSLRTLLGRLIHPLYSPLRDLRGPPSPSWFYGSLRDIQKADALVLHEKWVEEYGKVYRYKGFFNSDRLFIMDNRAIGHVLAHASDYQKPEQMRYHLGQLLGHGLLFVEGEQHKQQRRIMSPAFGPPQIRALTSIFVEKSNQLRDCWIALFSRATPSDDEPSLDLPKTTIEVLSWFNKMTLDVIGLAGFNYSFNALNPEQTPNELNTAMRTMFSSLGPGGGVLAILQAALPIFNKIPTDQSRRIAAAQATMRRIGLQLLASRKAAVHSENAQERRGSEGESGAPDIGRADIKGKDLLSLLVKANMANDVKEGSRMEDDDVLAQVPTFLIAGHETTSTSVTWALYALSVHTTAQDRLRESLPPPPSEGVTMEFLNGLPELDRVVRETMRLYAPVSGTIRVATCADVIPTASDWVDRKGSQRVTIFIPILAVNRSPEIWGQDAGEFKPGRWENMPEAAQAIPGIWGNSLAFSGGTRACIGYRFSVIEMKALLYTLIRAFHFSMSVPTESIRTKSQLVTRPFIDGKIEEGAQLPLYVSLVGNED